MTDDFFLSFAAHAHTRNELETDQAKEVELRKKNSPAEARKLTEMALEKLEKDILNRGHSLDEVKLLVFYQSYRGEPAEKDGQICSSILEAIENRFKKHDANQLRLVGHTTAGELENEDVNLKEVSGTASRV